MKLRVNDVERRSDGLAESAAGRSQRCRRVRTMPVSCSFDGRMYGICDGNDSKLQKPFHVVSTSERL
eukprot:16450636-Heterocapsa_arctica.AAC.1